MEQDASVPSVSPIERFSQAIAGLLLYLREGEDRSIQFLERILPQLQMIGRAAADAIAGLNDDSSVRELHLHALDQVVETAKDRWKEFLTTLNGEISKQKVGENDDDELWFEQQQELARFTELVLIFIRITVDIQSTDIKNPSSSVRIKTMNDSEDVILHEYAEYQRQLLRQRSKPAIASLVALRRNGAFSSTKIQLKPFGVQDDSDQPEVKHHHADAIATILQHSAHLQHPLLSWRASNPSPTSLISLCDTSIQTLQNQAVELVLPITTWFYEDQRIEAWLKQASEKDLTSGGNEQQLPKMDAAVSELSDICRMLQEYTKSVDPSRCTDDKNAASSAKKSFDSIHTSIKLLIAEWTVHYGALESFLVLQQYNSAQPHAIVTVVDSEIRVPSMVEDAHCLTMNALQRAPSLQTIAFALAHDVWSTEADTSASTVFGALERREGCLAIPDRNEIAPSSGNFADALASAIDEPSFALLDEHFCYWNGMYAASAAVRSFREALGDETDIVDNQTDSTNQSGSNDEVTILSIVREDLERFARTYESTVDQHLSEFVASLEFWDLLRSFFKQERFDLESSSALSVAEVDERLQAGISNALRSSRFVQQIPLKAEAHVQTVIWEKIAGQATTFLLGIIWEVRPSFTEWGALLFAKQMRVLRAAVPCEKEACWRGLTEVVALLQIEQPSDWLIYRDDLLKCLEIEKIAAVLSLRVDFSKEAVASVVQR